MPDKMVDAIAADPADKSAFQDDGAAGSAAGTERRLAEVLAGVVGVEQVPPRSHFFNDLGADSLVMAQFCARVRKREGLPAVSMRDIYRYPTIRSLAVALCDAAPVPAPSPNALVKAPAPAGAWTPVTPAPAGAWTPVTPAPAGAWTPV
ncbi:acyl carrier protein, partial [Streptomyces sp. NPDC001698]|uniref:acyl carrier protein n=1 Tax=Streptomyces sp. NPDC001698 TaxID=3364601 RepID=UPI00368E836A